MTIDKKKKYLIAVLVLAFLVIGGVMVRQTISFYRGVRQVKIPSHERKENRPPALHTFMHVGEVAQKLGISEAEVFSGLGITPAPGDEKLTLHALRVKYNITPDEMRERMQGMVEQRQNRSGP